MSIKLNMQVSLEDIESALNEVKEEKKIKKSEKPIQKKSFINIQQKICENIKQKVSKSMSMRLEQEEVLEDNSVLLTISI